MAKTTAQADAPSQAARRRARAARPHRRRSRARPKETDIRLDARPRRQRPLRGRDRASPFLDHMLELFARHGFFDLTVAGDGRPARRLPPHGRGRGPRARAGAARGARRQGRHPALRRGDACRSTRRSCRPSSTSRAGRSSSTTCTIAQQKIGQFDVELIHDFLLALVNQAGMNLHVRMLSGRNPHHIVEATFKGLARALDAATQRDRAARGRALDEGDARGMMREPLAIVDYGVGNLRSAQKAFEHLGQPALVTSDAERIARRAGRRAAGAGRVRRPAWRTSQRASLVEPVVAAAQSGRPFLGICVGMQLLFEESEESPGVRGLGIFRGRVVRFPRRPDLKVPHMGWNQLRIATRVPALADVADGDYVYFVHSLPPRAARPAT